MNDMLEILLAKMCKNVGKLEKTIGCILHIGISWLKLRSLRFLGYLQCLLPTRDTNSFSCPLYLSTNAVNGKNFDYFVSEKLTRRFTIFILLVLLILMMDARQIWLLMRCRKEGNNHLLPLISQKCYWYIYVIKKHSLLTRKSHQRNVLDYTWQFSIPNLLFFKKMKLL